MPLVALFLFIVVFAAMFVITMRKRAAAYDPLARMPLEDDEDDCRQPRPPRKEQADERSRARTRTRSSTSSTASRSTTTSSRTGGCTRSTAPSSSRAGYWFHYQTSGFGDLPRAEYQVEMDKAAAAEAARIKAAGVMTPEALVALVEGQGDARPGQGGLRADVRWPATAPTAAASSARTSPTTSGSTAARPGQGLQDDHDGRPRQGHARVGTAARPDARPGRHGLRPQPPGHQRRRGKAPQGERDTL